MSTLSERDKLFFEKLDREAELLGVIDKKFPQFDLHHSMNDLSVLLLENFYELKECFEFDNRIYEPGELQAIFELSRRRLFNYLSVIHSCVDVSYGCANRIKKRTPDVAAELTSRIDAFKHSGINRIGLSMRNKVQHRGLFSETLNVGYRTKHHPKGEGIDYKFKAASTLWKGVRKQVPTEHRSLFDEITNSRNPFLEFHKRFEPEFRGLVNELIGISGEEDTEDFTEVRSTVTELEEISQWYDKNGSSGEDLRDKLKPVKRVCFP